MNTAAKKSPRLLSTTSRRSDIPDKIREHPYRFLICADKFQTGYDEPLLHTMYVDKALSGVKAVQTLSRLNRARPQKHDTFVLDFMNDSETIRASFEPYYRTTILAEETDANKLHDLKAALDRAGVYAFALLDEFVKLYLNGSSRETLDPLLDGCVAVYLENLDEDGQVEFQGKGEGLCTKLRLPFVDPAVHQCRMGEAVYLFDFPRSQTARSAGRGLVEGHSRNHRHGQLPCGEEGSDQDSIAGSGCRNRAGARGCPWWQGKSRSLIGCRASSRHLTTNSVT